MSRILSISLLMMAALWCNAQVIDAPTIDCVSTNENNGDVRITWTTPPPDNCGPFLSYVIYGSNSINGPYQIIDTVPAQLATSYDHLGADALNLDWFYYLETNYDCPGTTPAQSDTVQEEPLITPDMNFVTVTDSGVFINWFSSTSSQTVGYIVYYFDGFVGNPPLPQATPIDTIVGINDTTFLDTQADPTTGSVEYTIAAFDGCGTTSLFNELRHNTIFLGTSVNSCDQTIDLAWNPYINWPGVSGYLVESSVDGAAYTTADNLPDGSQGYQFSTQNSIGDSICFRITAVHQNSTTTSTSNIVCLPLDLVRSTSYNFLRNVTVNAQGAVEVDWYIDSLADINTYFIDRSEQSVGLTAIDSITVTPPPSFLNTYTDSTAFTEDNAYYYQVTSRDDCGFTRASTTGRTILLSGTASAGINRLTWNAFELENATITSYTIYRQTAGTFIPLETVSPNELNLDDRVGTEVSEDGSFCYVIEVTFQLDLPSIGISETLTSRSNILCLDQPPVIYIPNAFVPDGTNNSFRPTLLNSNINDYEFKVFDRWGKELFTTDVLLAGWDGTNNGEKMPLGGYVYYVRVISRAGIEKVEKGAFVLVR